MQQERLLSESSGEGGLILRLRHEILQLQLLLSGSSGVVPAYSSAELLLLFFALLENVGFLRSDDSNELLKPLKMRDVTAFGKILALAPGRQQLSIGFEKSIKRALADIQGRQVRQEIVPDQKRHEHEVIEHALQVQPSVVGNRVDELDRDVLPQDAEVQHLELGLLRLLQPGRNDALVLPSIRVEVHHFSEQREVRLMGHQAQHDQVGIRAVHAVSRVWVVRRMLLELPHELHDLVLALPRDVRSAEDHGQVSPERILLELLPHEELDDLSHADHERGAGRDAVRVEVIRFVHEAIAALLRLGHRLHAIFRRSEPATTHHDSVKSAPRLAATPRRVSQGLYLRLRCWFIFARGATPSSARYSSRFGLTMPEIRRSR
eukprot:scaffold2286_cov240-Pinguiococcus_pyrenoidosus.AAC.12